MNTQEKEYRDLVALKLSNLNNAINDLEDILISNKGSEEEEKVTMKEQLISLVTGMVDSGLNLRFTPPVFMWEYPELPDFKFKLFITEKYDQEGLS